MKEKEQLFKFFHSALEADPKRQSRFIEFFDKYSEFTNFEIILDDDYKDLHMQYLKSISKESDQIVLPPSGPHITSSIEINESGCFELLREIERNTNRASQWIRFIGIVLLVVLLWLFISAIVTSI